MIEVNLLPTQLVLSARELSLRRILVGTLGVVSLVLIIDLVVFFLFQQLFKRQVADLLAARSNLTIQTEQYSTITAGLRTVEEKTAGIVVVQSFRKDLAAIVADVLKILVEGVELGDLHVEANGSLSFDAKAADVDSLGRFIDKINDQKGPTHLTKVILSGLRQNEGGSYQFQISAQYANF